MTTTIKVHVNGNYRTTIKQDELEPVVIEGNCNGGTEKQFHLPHPATGKFEITEEYMGEPQTSAQAAADDQA